MAVKIAFIGAGSVSFTRALLRDILIVPELQDAHFSMTDINKRNLDMIVRIAKKDIKGNKLPATISATVDRRKALIDADYVISCVRVGGLEAYKHDIEIPLKYNVDQCIGDTLAPGGIMYGQRNIPCILDFCKDMREVSKPNVVFLNYANPNVMNTWAANAFGKVNTIGLCHGVQHGHEQIAKVLGAKSVDEVDIICAGINHQTWYTQIIYKGHHITAEALIEGFEKHPEYSKTEKVRIDVLKRFGYYSTESNGHLSEYLPWYRKRPKDIRKWINLSNWINGETGGYLRVSRETRNWFIKDFPKILKESGKPILPEQRSTEHASYIIESLETGRVYRGHFNVPNRGVVSNLPDDCIVEVPVYVDGNGFSVPMVGDLPLACTATLSASINVQRMSVLAAVNGDLMLLKQAMLHDPLTAAVCDPEEVWQMTDEMLVAQARWLPQYAQDISAAKKRLASAKRSGEYRGTYKSKGAARLKTKKAKKKA